jgi:hypothetical protein
MAVSRSIDACSFHTVTSAVLEMGDKNSVEHAPSIVRVELPPKPIVYVVLYINVSVMHLASYHTIWHIRIHLDM